MIVQEKMPIHGDGQHFIEFGISTWTEKAPEDEQTESVRRRYEGETGRFSPRGSSEIPIEDMGLLMRECIKRDKIGLPGARDKAIQKARDYINNINK